VKTLSRAVGISLFGLMLANSCFAKKNSKIETLYELSLYNKSVHFDVKSTGCTRSEDFKVKLSTLEDNPKLTIYRIRPDRCKGAPKTVSLVKSVDYSDVSFGDDVVILNPFKVIY